jgi:hypothetical protein
MPTLSSLPGAPATLYLNFGGDFIPSWAGASNISIPAFDTDGDGAPLSQTEVTTITQIWQTVAENYAPFNINVTTVAPAGTTAHVSQIDIGGNGAWTGGSYGGLSQVGGLAGSTGSNPDRGFVFPANLANGNPWYTGQATSHESGHTMGLYHQSSWSGTAMTTEYYGGPGDGTAPIIGVSYYATRGMWWYGTNDISSTTYQNDMDVIAGNGFGYRANTANSTTSAAPLTVSGNNVSANGIISKMSDLDYWSFASSAGTVSLTVAAPSNGNLYPKFEVVNSAGTAVVAWQDSNASSGSWSGILPAGSYYLVVASHGVSSMSTATNYGFDVGSYSVSGTVLTSGTTVAAPTSLSATAASSSQINLSWTDNATNATGYSVERSMDGATWGQVASLGATNTAYSDTGLTSGSSYYYRVRAFDGTIASSYSNQASATTLTTQALPAAPSNLVATAVSSTKIHLTWTDNASNETGYAVERAVYNKNGTLSSWAQIATVGASSGTGGTVSFDDTTVTNRKSYSYRVRAYNASGYSAYTGTTPSLAGGLAVVSGASTAFTHGQPVAPSSASVAPTSSGTSASSVPLSTDAHVVLGSQSTVSLGRPSARNSGTWGTDFQVGNWESPGLTGLSGTSAQFWLDTPA